MSRQESSFGAFVMGFFVGALIGAGAGLLFAPQAGEETREQIKSRGAELGEQAGHRADEARGRAEHILADAKAKLDEATKDLQARAKELEATIKKTKPVEGQPAVEAQSPVEETAITLEEAPKDVVVAD